MTLAEPRDKAGRKAWERNNKKRARVLKDRRRIKEAPIATGQGGRTAEQGIEGTMHKRTVLDPATTHHEVLKEGRWNSKIGGDVLVGPLKGAVIYTLSLEERATCPRSCDHWLTCYGNSMQHAHRWKHGKALMARLRQELADLCDEFEHVLIRLHVLGDFYSAAYVCFWDEMLETHENLSAFGFTAHKPGTKLGDLIALTREIHGHHFAIRHSSTQGEWGSFTIDFPTAKRRIGGGLVCPEQANAIDKPELQTHCGNCGACWSGSQNVVFIEH